MIQYLDTPVFGVGVSILAYSIGLMVAKRTKLAIMNPLLVAMVIVISILTILGVDYQTYNKGGAMITFFLGPATVVLAVPLYRQWELLKSNLMPILTGIAVGSIAGVASIIILGRLLDLDTVLIASMVPKSTTTPIAIEISAVIGGNPSLTATFVSITGITGFIAGVRIIDAFGIRNPIAKGIAMGTASHAVGTAKAMEVGEVEGAMSSLSIGVAGIITVFLIPVIMWFL
ncbi:LrgB family protein [Gudongella oleilytica]|jgi:predicted murein hydrolase (TIGR00659 family)|uniref:LrgB family protein n=1 Tax=Gudongella oleilytica TaxID=1582259 RepID=UPI002A35D812|nr:LrgB family protein [Gudongella oleilytica]MDY0257050.1 LrgB family protein [Gudongella oleilytica]